MGLLYVILVAASFVMTAFHYWKRLCHDELVGEERRLFIRWLATGFGLPCAAWFFFNVGLLGPPVWPTIPPISAGVRVWWTSLYRPLAAGWFLITSYWAGVTALWLLWRLSDRVEDKKKFFAVCGFWSVLVVPVTIVCILIGKWGALGITLMLSGVALLQAVLGLKTDAPLPPSYARAQAKISFGKYEEAETEVIRELEQCEEDFDGWMMLAELYATRFNDLPAADQAIRDLCEQSTTTPVQVSVALHRLADWHLKLAHDPIGAKQVLEKICARLPGTHLDRMARQRINRLPATSAELLEQEKGKPLHLPAVPEDVIRVTPILPRDQAATVADECVKVLQQNPDDVSARERFARVLADNLGDAKTGIEQLELLLAMPGQPATKRADWLLTIAEWHARHRDDLATAKLVYHEVMRDFPDTMQAFTAQRRLNLVNLQAEFRRRFGDRLRTAV